MILMLEDLNKKSIHFSTDKKKYHLANPAYRKLPKIQLHAMCYERKSQSR